MRRGQPPGLARAPCSRVRSWRTGCERMSSLPIEISTVEPGVSCRASSVAGAGTGVVQRILDSFVGIAAFVRNEWLDVLAANALGEAFYAPLYDDSVRPVNSARFVFLTTSACPH